MCTWKVLFSILETRTGPLRPCGPQEWVSQENEAVFRSGVSGFWVVETTVHPWLKQAECLVYSQISCAVPEAHSPMSVGWNSLGIHGILATMPIYPSRYSWAVFFPSFIDILIFLSFLFLTLPLCWIHFVPFPHHFVQLSICSLRARRPGHIVQQCLLQWVFVIGLLIQSNCKQ